MTDLLIISNVGLAIALVLKSGKSVKTPKSKKKLTVKYHDGKIKDIDLK